jgi:hypothetical protein
MTNASLTRKPPFIILATREWLVNSTADHKFTNNSIQFDVLWDTGETTCEPLSHCKDLATLDNYLKLHGVMQWHDLPHNQKMPVTEK